MATLEEKETWRRRKIALDEAHSLTHGDILYSKFYRNADHSPERWRVNGKVKRWKRDPERFEIPIKRGLYEYGYFTNADLDAFTLDEFDAYDPDELDNLRGLTKDEKREYTRRLNQYAEYRRHNPDPRL